MTREEKAQEFARNCAEYNNLPIEVEHLLHTAFIAGYNERDDEEKNPWHKASEELPEVPENRKYVKVLTTLCHGSGYDFRILYFHKEFGFSKYKDYTKVYFKDQKASCGFWMYIPEIKED